MSKSFKLVLLAITACFLAYSNASAKTWWLPDWQGGQDSRGSADDGGGDIVKDDSDCMKHYNLYTKMSFAKVIYRCGSSRCRYDLSEVLLLPFGIQIYVF